jgi:hypothetical protein
MSALGHKQTNLLRNESVGFVPIAEVTLIGSLNRHGFDTSVATVSRADPRYEGLPEGAQNALAATNP